MIKERMLELLLLERTLQQYEGLNKIGKKHYDNKRMIERYNYLLEEFLEPYVLDFTSKE